MKVSKINYHLRPGIKFRFIHDSCNSCTGMSGVVDRDFTDTSYIFGNQAGSDNKILYHVTMDDEIPGQGHEYSISTKDDIEILSNFSLKEMIK